MLATALDRLYDAAFSASRVCAYLAGAVLFAAVGVVAFEVLARKAFNYSIVGADELSGYALALSSAWGFPYALFRRAHLRVDALYNYLSPVLCRWLDVVALCCFTLLIGYITLRAAFTLGETVERNVLASTPLATPLVYPQGAWVAGLVFFCVCLVIVTLRAGLALWRGDMDLVRDIAAAPSVAGEAEGPPTGPAPAIAGGRE